MARSEPRLRSWIGGLASAPVVAAALVALTVNIWPDWPGVRTLTAILDSLVFHIIAFGLAGIVAMILLRAPWPATLLTAGALLGALGLTLASYLPRTAALEPNRPADITLLWFNLLYNNPTPPERLAAALIDSPADLIILSEASRLARHLDLFAEDFPVRRGCDEPDPDRSCQILVLARNPGATVAFQRLGRIGERRLARIQWPRPDGTMLNLVGLHLFKPWFFGITESEKWDMLSVLEDLDSPLVLAGDLNAAPWSATVRDLTDRCALRGPRWPVPTWPKAAGRYGLPIDHVLGRGVALRTIAPWGGHLGSNHFGLLASISVTDFQDIPAPAGCKPDPHPSDRRSPAETGDE